MSRKIMILIVICSFLYVPYTFANESMFDGTVLMHNGNIELLERSSNNENKYAIRIASEDEQCYLLFMANGSFVVATRVGYMNFHNEYTTVHFGLGTLDPFEHDLEMLGFPSIAINNSQRFTVHLLNEMRKDKQALRIVVMRPEDDLEMFTFNLEEFIPVCNEFFKKVTS